MRGLTLLMTVLLIAGCSGGERTDSQTEGSRTASTPFQDGMKAYEDGRYDQAFALLRDVPEDHPQAASVHNTLGMIQARNNKLGMAAIEFEQALKIDPQFAAAQRNLGLVRLEQGDLGAAEAALEDAAQLDPYDRAVHEGLAEVYYRTDRLDQAKTELNLLNELAASGEQATADFEIGQRLDVAQRIAEDETAKRNEAEAKARAEAKRLADAAKARAAKEAAKPKTVTVRASAAPGTVLTLSLNDALSSKTAQVGEPIYATIVGDIVDGDTALIKNGAQARGKITEVESSGRVKGRARLAFTFDEVETVAGWREIQAHLVEGAIEAESTKKQDAAKVGIGAAAGAILGKIIGDKAGVGAVIGGAAGTAVVLTTRGEEVEVEPGTGVQLALERTLAINVTKTVAD